MSKKKPNGYWKVKDNVIAEIARVMKEHGLDSIPSSKLLKDLNESSLGQAISSHGGYTEFRKLLGEKEIRVKNGLWKNPDYIFRKAKDLMDKNGLDKFPGQRELRDLGYTRMMSAISVNYGGLQEFRKKLYAHIGSPDCDPGASTGNKLKNLNIAIWASKTMMQELCLKTLPSGNRLNTLGYGNLTRAILKYHCGFHAFRHALGEQQKMKEMGYYKCPDNVISEVKKVMADNGLDSVPTAKELRELGESGLVYAIKEYQGGMTKFRGLMGDKKKRHPWGAFKDIQYCMDCVKDLMDKKDLDRLPTQRELKENNLSTLSTALSKYHEGKESFEQKLAEYIGAPTEKERLEAMLDDYNG